MNPIIPHSDWHRNPFESDFLVYTQGNLFCIEVKRYKGRITYAQQSRTSSFGERGRNAHSQRIEQENVDGVDDSMIVQQKTGNYGEPLPPKMHPNPLRKTRTFIRFLKEYLAENVDARFRTFFIIPVVAFVEEADISAIHSLKAGMIYVRELPTFFQQHAHPTFARRPSAWVVKGIQKLPASDLIITTDDEPFKGNITDSMLSFKRRDGQLEQIPYSDVRSVGVQHTWLFSDFDCLTIFFSQGHFQEYECASGVVHMTSFGGEVQTHKLRNVQKIVIGNPFRWNTDRR